MRGFGGLISFDVGSLDAAKTVLAALRLMALAESLGGVETLISHPAIMTHASVPPDRRAMLGITDGLIRISVGIEDVEDLKADLDQAVRCRLGLGLGLGHDFVIVLTTFPVDGDAEQFATHAGRGTAGRVRQHAAADAIDLSVEGRD